MWHSTLQKDNNEDKFTYIIKLQELFYMKIHFKNDIAYFYNWWGNLTAPAVICNFTLQHSDITFVVVFFVQFKMMWENYLKWQIIHIKIRRNIKCVSKRSKVRCVQE